MTILRRLLFIPFSAAVAVAFGFAWFSIFHHATYSSDRLIYSMLGLAPLVFGRLLPVALFVIIGVLIAPRPRKVTVAFLGILGGVFGWPFGPTYEVSIGGPTFYLAEGIGAVAGAGIGMLIGFAIARKKQGPNQALQPTPMLVTPRADARVAPSTGVADL